MRMIDVLHPGQGGPTDLEALKEMLDRAGIAYSMEVEGQTQDQASAIRDGNQLLRVEALPHERETTNDGYDSYIRRRRAALEDGGLGVSRRRAPARE